jgi:aspartyl protease family protein
MSGEQAPSAIYLALWLMLVVSALVSRRLPVGKMIRMALAWVAIFATVFALILVLRS